jgi:hypothetical protein
VTPGRGLRTFAIVFGAASLAAVASGAFVAAETGVGVRAWGLNFAAWGVGLAAFAATARFAGPRALVVCALAAVAGIGLTLVSPDLQGVHRWLQAGPIRLNAAELLAPALVVAVAATAGRGLWPWIAAGAALALFAAQPDASQATALAAAVIVMICLSPLAPATRALGVLATAGAAAVAWSRPDPLAPVPEVEEIFRLAGAVSPVLLGVSAVALAAASVSPMILGRGVPSARTAALALSAYFIVAAIAPLLGAFPTPLVGMGESPILGSWLGAGVLAAVARRAAAPA